MSLIVTVQFSLGYFFICPCVLSSDFIQPNSTLLPSILSKKAGEFQVCPGKDLSELRDPKGWGDEERK